MVFSAFFIKKTPNWLISMLFLLFLSLYIVVWLLLGELNLAQLQTRWLVNSQTKRFIALNLIYVLVGCLCFSLLVVLFLQKINKMHWDFYPFWIMSQVFGWILIISGLIPFRVDNYFGIIVARLVLVLASMVLVFILSNAFISYFLLKKQDNGVLYAQIQKKLAHKKPKAKNNKKASETVFF